MKPFSAQKETTIHLLYWLVFVAGYFIQLNPNKDIVFEIQPVNMFGLSYLAIVVGTFYVNYFLILKKFFDATRLRKFLIGLVLAFGFFILSRYLIEEVLYYHVFGTGNYFEGTPLTYYIFDNIHWASTPVIASTIMWLVINFIRSLQNEVSLNEEKKKAEIQFLKSQINPHFIFNTLNNIYSLVFSKSEKALPAIEKLSEIMRFTTYETQKERIPVNSEIKYIESFIELEKIRNSKEIFISFQTQIDDDNLLVPPYLLLPFIENCIKHGVLDESENPVLFSVVCTSEKLSVKVHNTINKRLKDTHSGIGLQNLEKRLDHYFPERYRFEVSNDDRTFKSHLEITL